MSRRGRRPTPSRDPGQRRLEAKLAEKSKQIAREEHLLKTETEDGALQASLRHAIRDRQELQLLLAQVREQLEHYARSV